MAVTERLRIEFQVAGLPRPAEEYRFARPRLWRFDFAWLDERIAVEYEGGTWRAGGRHTTGKGFRDDCIKYNAAAALGWRVYRFTADMVESGQMRIFLEGVWTGLKID